MNKMQRSYLKILIFVIVVGLLNFFFNPNDGIQSILNWVVLISIAGLLMLIFDAAKQYDKDGNRISKEDKNE